MFQNQNMLELKMRLEELQMENEYQLRLKDMNYNEKLKDISDKFIQQIESLKKTQEVCCCLPKSCNSDIFNICVPDFYCHNCLFYYCYSMLLR